MAGRGGGDFEEEEGEEELELKKKGGLFLSCLFLSLKLGRSFGFPMEKKKEKIV